MPGPAHGSGTSAIAASRKSGCGQTLVCTSSGAAEFLILTCPAERDRTRFDVLLSLRARPIPWPAVRNFELVARKLMHLFLVSEDPDFLRATHIRSAEDGSFQLSVDRPPRMYRLLADIIRPAARTQLAVNTLLPKICVYSLRQPSSFPGQPFSAVVRFNGSLRD